MMIFIGFVLSLLFSSAMVLGLICYSAYKQDKSIKQATIGLIKMFEVERAQPSDYVRTFVNNDSGQKVLEQLVTVFASDTYVRGGADAERESCYKQGQKSVIDHINYAIARAKTDKGEKLDG